MYLRDDAAERSPTLLIESECHRLLPISDEMGAQDGPHPGGLTGVLKLHGSVHSIGVGAGQRTEPPLGCCLSECLGTGDADAEGEVGVDVEVSKHE
jgi:hypothetical protein